MGLVKITEKIYNYLKKEAKDVEAVDVIEEQELCRVGEIQEVKEVAGGGGPQAQPQITSEPGSSSAEIVGALPEAARSYGVDASAVLERLFCDRISGPSGETDAVQDEKWAFLTFDDGPSKNTPKILDVLKRYGVHATFFVLGSNLCDDTFAQAVKRELNEGHAIGNHTFSHDYGKLYPNGRLNIENFKSELKRTSELLCKILGRNFRTRVMRCPGGSMSWKRMEPLAAFCKENNMLSVDWNVLAGDAERTKRNRSELLANIEKQLSGQETVILLMHDAAGKEETAEAVGEIIELFQREGYLFKVLV